jgi:ESCRT-II complex subunit VPS22
LNPLQEQYRSTGEEVRRASLQQMKDQLSLFKSKLEDFALQHKADIRRDPVFRAQFHTMCANIGVDPLASNKVGLVWLLRAAAAGMGRCCTQLALS